MKAAMTGAAGELGSDLSQQSRTTSQVTGGYSAITGMDSAVAVLKGIQPDVGRNTAASSNVPKSFTRKVRES